MNAPTCLRRVALAFFICTAVAACGGGGGGGGAAPPEPATTLGAAGGSVRSADGKVTVSVGANALQANAL